MSPEHIEHLTDTLVQLEADIETRREDVQGRARGVGLMIRGLAAAMAILALSNLYFVNALTEEVKLMTMAMQEMTGHFANVSERMDSITLTLQDMDESVALMPVMREQMRTIAGHVAGMGEDVTGMRRSTDTMDARMDALNTGVFDMSRRFRALNASVAGMGADVDQMARPIP
jgi:uncharacterized protein YoxC